MKEGGNRSRGNRPVRVLVVDDDPAVADLAGEYLEHTTRELTVRTETTPADALARVETADERFDCIVSDYEMPEMNGLEFHAAVRDAAENVPFILFTVRDAARVGDEARSAVTDYVRKDGSAGLFDELADSVSRAVDGAT
jgi:CheY-like chemotaxis protein